MESLREDLEDRKRRLIKVIAALEIADDVRSLVGRARDLESEIKRIEEAIGNHRPVRVDLAVGEIRDYVRKALLGLRELLSRGDEGDLARAKKAGASDYLVAAGARSSPPQWK